MTKKERILWLTEVGLNRHEIAVKAACTPGYVNLIQWRQRNPTYNRDWMATRRLYDPGIYKKAAP